MRNGIIWALSRIRNRIPGIMVMTAAHVGNALLGVLFALGTRNVIDSATSGELDGFRRACLMQGGIVLGLLISQLIYRHLHDRLLDQLDRDWKKMLLGRILRSDYRAVSRFHSAELLNRMNNDVRTLDSGLLEAMPNVAALAARLIAAMTVLTSMEPGFSLLICSLGAAIVLFTGFLRKKIKTLHKRVSEKDGIVSGFLQEAIEKLLMIQAMDVAGEISRRSSALMQDRYQVQRHRKNVSLAANTSVSLMSLGGGFAALVWCSARLLRGEISFGSLTAVIQLVNQLQAPIFNLSAVIPRYIAMCAAAERLQELEQLETEAEPLACSREELYDTMTCIRAEGLCFSYDRDTVMRDGSFVLPKGAFTVVTGPSGIGKSTLLKLMLGIIHPDDGEIWLECGAEQIRMDRTTRRLFAYVPQGNLLLSGTLRDNLTIACPDADDAAIRQAMYVSAMDDYLSQLPLGLDTLLGESGAGLSEGQAQRLAIARAILSGAPILLLDEATSALDEKTEQTVLQRMRRIPGRTCIAVTHRPAALAMCDWILELGRDGIRLHRCSVPE